MHIEKYTAYVKDTLTKKSFKLSMDGDCPMEAHKSFYNRINNYQEIVKITDASNATIYDSNTGFINS
ncbi:hypothetical protein EB118_26370 [bacterium]|nr:hypothetical protein [bacterium]